MEDAIRASLVQRASYLVAVSGGIDSMALLSAVIAVSDEFELKLGVAHVDHGVRKDSLQDSQLVERFSKQAKLPFFSGSLPKLPSGANFEQFARDYRYRFFSECLEKGGFEKVLVAHHAEDNLETFLMRLLSNKESRSIKEVNLSLSVLRPFLTVSKEMLRRYVELKKIPYREDSTNSDLKFLRNKVRNKLVPFISDEFGEEAISALREQAKTIDSLYVALDEVAKDFIVSSELSDPGSFLSKVWLRELTQVLNRVPAPLGERILRKLFRPFTEVPLGNKTLRELRTFLLGQETAIQLSGGFEVRRRRGGLALSSLLPRLEARYRTG